MSDFMRGSIGIAIALLFLIFTVSVSLYLRAEVQKGQMTENESKRTACAWNCTPDEGVYAEQLGGCLCISRASNQIVSINGTKRS